MENRIPAEIPASFETARLLLRCPRAGDGAEYFSALQDSLTEIRPWFDVARLTGPAACEELVEEQIAEFAARQRFEFLAFLKDSPRMAGRVSLAEIVWEIPAFAVGYWLRTPCAGQGLMTEAVKGLTRFAIRALGANRLVIYCNALNVRSAALARRAGYAYEGTHFRDGRNPRTGELTNTNVFAFFPEMLTEEDV